MHVLTKDGRWVPMVDSLYESEDYLQGLLAEHPELMAGELVNAAHPRRWLLLTREAGIALAGDSGGSRWSMDHLFVDQDSTPTLVEVKRSSDTRSRREVVAQMLDYASNLWAWPPGKAKDCLVKRCGRDGSDPDAELEALSPESDPDTFWSQVDANIAAGYLRLVFVADRIGPELRQIIEFLNSQFAKAEVLAVEIRQWRGEGVDTLVSEVIGRTAASEGLKPTPRRWERDEFFSAMRERCTPSDAEGTAALIAWWEEQGGWMSFGTGKSYPACFLNWRAEDPLWPLSPTLPNSVSVPFDALSIRPPFKENPSLLDDFRQRLLSVDGMVLTPARTRPSFPMSVLGNSIRREQLEDALRWFIMQVAEEGSVAEG
jgi:hypothetical protein